MPDSYPGFEHKATALSAFSQVIDIFTIMLKTGGIVHFTPKDEKDFRKWLSRHRIRDIDVGKNKTPKQ